MRRDQGTTDDLDSVIFYSSAGLRAQIESTRLPADPSLTELLNRLAAELTTSPEALVSSAAFSLLQLLATDKEPSQGETEQIHHILNRLSHVALRASPREGSEGAT